MSRIAVISCVHGNIEALEAVYDDIRASGIGKVICLGDLVGYGPYPNEVVRFIERENIKTVQGCWDQGIGDGNSDCGCTYVSSEEGELGKLAYAWTRERVQDGARAFLRALPFAVRVELGAGSALFVHASPRSNSEYLLESASELTLLERASEGACDILVCGHTHVPYARKVSGALRVSAQAPLPSSESREIALSPKLIVNAGSVGEPRHGGSESTYVVLDGATGAVEIRKVEYDVGGTVRAMQRESVPEVLVERFARSEEMTGKLKSAGRAVSVSIP